MIIDSIKITNFGLYKNENIIPLSPNVLNNKNITIISGQNGVGKSTMLEAIHLCLLGSLSIDNRLSESNYEKYLYKRAYKGHQSAATTLIELNIEFVKSGEVVKYKIARAWTNNSSNVDESITIEENGKPLSELNKKEKNLFLRELIQPGLAKVMFFDGEKLLSLYDESNLTSFIAESCRYLFGLNFVDLLNTDLNYYINKLYTQKDAVQILAELAKVKGELTTIDAEIVDIESEKSQLAESIIQLKNKAAQTEKKISDQGRWVGSTLNDLKKEKHQLENETANLKKELVELYSSLGPFVFCKTLLRELKERLFLERDIDNWFHARQLLDKKLDELADKLKDASFLKELSITEIDGQNIIAPLREFMLKKPQTFIDGETIYHEMSDSDRSVIIGWIDEVLNTVAGEIKKKSERIGAIEQRSKILIREQATFSKDDMLGPLMTEFQEINKKIGAEEQRLSSLNKKSEEAHKRKEYYSGRLLNLQQKMQLDSNVDERLKLTSRTKLVLEAYGKQLLSKKLDLLQEKVLDKFNLLCRKDSYLDQLIIDPQSFEIRLGRKNIIVEHAHLSAGEKQLLIISFLWGLRELTNISLPLIIDTPLARLDLEHRKAFVEQFLPAIHPQVILIGTDMELAGDVMTSLETHIANHYFLEYDFDEQASKLTKLEKIFKENMTHEV